jgi:hypothetical protein
VSRIDVRVTTAKPPITVGVAGADLVVQLSVDGGDATPRIEPADTPEPLPAVFGPANPPDPLPGVQKHGRLKSVASNMMFERPGTEGLSPVC